MAACVSTAPLCVEQGVVAVGLRLAPEWYHKNGSSTNWGNSGAGSMVYGPFHDSARAMPMTEW